MIKRNTYKHIALTLLLFAGGGLSKGIAGASPEPVVYSDFSSSEVIEVEDDSLVQRNLQTGGGRWSVSGSVILQKDSSLSSRETGLAWFPLAHEVDAVKVRGKVRANNSEWVALVLGRDFDENFWREAQLWVLIRETGYYELHSLSGEKSLAEGTVPDFSRGENAVDLRYDTATNQVSLTLNGQKVLEGMSLGEFRPELTSAGVRFHRTEKADETGPAVSDLEVEVVGKRVPVLGLRMNDLSVYDLKENFEIEVSAEGVAVSGSSALLKVVDYFGTTVWETRKAITAPDGRWEEAVQLGDFGKQGYFQLHYSINNSDGEELSSLLHPFAVLPQPPPERLEEANPFGAMVRAHAGYPYSEKELDARHMERLGLRFVRSHRFNFIHFRGTEDASIDWENTDRECDLYERYGLKIIATTGWPVPNWASGAADKNTKQQKSLFFPSDRGLKETTDFMKRLAERYRDRIEYYQIGNEMDAAGFWLGRYEHQLQHDIPSIIRDYFDYYLALRSAIQAGDPDARVLPSTTSAKDGHTYHPWLTSMLDLGAGKVFDAYGTHYGADLSYVLDKFTEYGVSTELPIVITEIGGMSRVEQGNDPLGEDMKRSIRDDYRLITEQLASPANVVALCKFLLREEATYGHEGTIVAGLLSKDFHIRPSYAAYATLVYHLIGTRYTGELHVTSRAEAGWLRGYSFEKNDRPLHVLFHNGASAASRVTLETGDDSVVVVDVMGNRKVIAAEDGAVSFMIDPVLPLLVLGDIQGDPGPPNLPGVRLVSQKKLSLKNANFEKGLRGWLEMVDETGTSDSTEASGFKISIDSDTRAEGNTSIRFEADEPSQWYGVSQNLPLSEIPIPENGEYLLFKVSLMAKGEKVMGKGLGYTLAFRDNDFKRLSFKGSPYFGFGGSFDWKPLHHENKLTKWPTGAELVSLDILMGLSTGTLWVDEVVVEVQLWRDEFQPEESPE